MKVMTFLVFFSIASNALACGGGPITEQDILNSPLTKKAQIALESLVGEELALKTVKLSGSEILDLDMNVVAMARCAANYISIYYVSKNESRVVCHAAGEVKSDNRYYLSAGKCRLANGQVTDWLYF